MPKKQTIDRNIREATKDNRMREILKRMAGAFLESEEWQSDSTSDTWKHIRRDHLVMLADRFSREMEKMRNFEYEDVLDRLNPLRTLWIECFSKYATKSVKATNHVTKYWTTSALEDNSYLIQQQALERNSGLSIQRIYILEDELSANALHELSHSIVMQLNAGIDLWAINARAVDYQLRFDAVRTKDFVVFDDEILYTTYVDASEIERENTRVSLSNDLEIVEEAAKLWNILAQRADQLTHQNLREHVNPYR